MAVVNGLAAGALAVSGAAAAQAAPPVPTADPPGPPCGPGVPGPPGLPVGGPSVVVDATTRPAPITDLG
ncbi:hypothetical protein ACQPX6_10430 [Actinomycetospora sp. CA-101289]|uniref:hypothetical protein n=1 Tax=Actinomycetospora sp. CA-101289 TaxID=3239893 RepID=UPI003D98B22E